jgi:Arc/MetJ-type ribon-helix-helix transcriptional regulator
MAKTKPISVRIPVEKERIYEQQARELGYENLTDFIRNVIEEKLARVAKEENQCQQEEQKENEQEISLDIPGVEINKISFEEARNNWKQSLREMSELKRKNVPESEQIQASILMRKWERIMLIKLGKWSPFREQMLAAKIRRKLGIPEPDSDENLFSSGSGLQDKKSLREFLDAIEKRDKELNNQE